MYMLLCRMTGKYQCTLSKRQCSAKARGDAAWGSAETKHYSPPPASAAATLCSYRDNVDFRGGTACMQTDAVTTSVAV